MNDHLKISSLKILTHVGTHAWEQQILQQLLVDIDILTDVSQCNDLLENTIDYSALCHLVTTFVETHSFQLIETVAESIASLIKQNFNVDKLTVTVSKPHAIKNAANISISIAR